MGVIGGEQKDVLHSAERFQELEQLVGARRLLQRLRADAHVLAKVVAWSLLDVRTLPPKYRLHRVQAPKKPREPPKACLPSDKTKGGGLPREAVGQERVVGRRGVGRGGERGGEPEGGDRGVGPDVEGHDDVRDVERLEKLLSHQLDAGAGGVFAWERV